MNTPHMSSLKQISTQFAHLMVVKAFIHLMSYFNKQGLTNISQVLLYSAVIHGIGYGVHKLITTWLLPYKKYSHE